VETLPESFAEYAWAPSTSELAVRCGLDVSEIVRFDGNVPAWPRGYVRPGAVAGALARVNTYAHGGYPELIDAIAEYVGVGPGNIVLGNGSDDLILLCARMFAGPGDTVAVAGEPTYPLYRTAAMLAGATVDSESPSVTYQCRPNNPSGALEALDPRRPLVVDEAYFEYCGDTAVGEIETGVVVLRTFSKAFGLAGARVGYAVADSEIAAELRRRQAPLPLSAPSVALAMAALADPPDVGPEIAERERCAAALDSLGLQPLPSSANFLFVPTARAVELGDSLLTRGLVVRVFEDGIRFSVRDREDDDLLLEALAETLELPSPVEPAATRRVRHLRSTAETRISVRLGLDGQSRVRVATGAGIYDHFLEQLGFHGGFDLTLEADGDLETGDHHTAEDAAIALGEALDLALTDRRGIARYGDAVVPMDDALARAAVDLGGRPWSEIALEHEPGMAAHMFQSLSQAGRLGIHVDATGVDAHHVAEAAFKAVGRALRIAVRKEGDALPSTKGKI
jgi:histidinol-phosphate/aromatic aminotransferase/cobyric acid decarboxylase-like protein/imidazoleglycerol phosphate dehydratase HisB